jgi:hypothetical protein
MYPLTFYSKKINLMPSLAFVQIFEASSKRACNLFEPLLFPFLAALISELMIWEFWPIGKA